MSKDKILFGLRIAISLGLLLILLWIMRNDAGDILRILKNSNKVFLAIALVINIPLTVLLSYRLKLLMEGQKMYLPMKDVIYLTFLGYFFNNFLPTSIGGDIVKAHYASKRTNNKVASYAAVLSDRLFGLMATVFIAAVGLAFIGKSIQNKGIIYMIIFICAALVLLTFFLLGKKGAKQPVFAAGNKIINKIKEIIYRLYLAINLYRNNLPLLAKIFLLSVFLQSVAIVNVYFFILSLGGEILLLKLFLIIPIVWTVSMLPSLNGLGVREGAFIYFLKGDIGADMAFAVSLLWLGVIIIYSIIGGIMHLLYPQIRGETVNDR